jgi:hypothetical protein
VSAGPTTLRYSAGRCVALRGAAWRCVALRGAALRGAAMDRFLVKRGAPSGAAANGERGGEPTAKRHEGGQAAPRAGGQSRLSDCKKVVDLGAVRAAQDALVKSHNALLRLDVQLSRAEAPGGGGGGARELEAAAAARNTLERERGFEERALLSALGELEGMFISLECLELTRLGKSVNKVAQGGSAVPPAAQGKAQALVAKWRATCDEAFKTRQRKQRDEQQGRVPVLRRVN